MRRLTIRIGAYMTLEATLIMPIVISVIILIIYMWFFQYDRCLMEQDSNAVSLRAASVYAKDNKERYELLGQYVESIYSEKYAAWSYNVKYGIEKNKVKVTISGKLKFPFGGSELFGQSDVWESKTENVNSILSPSFVVRQARKMKIVSSGLGGEE